MIECNAIIESNNEIDKLKRENNILKASNGEYEDALARLEEKNDELKQQINELQFNKALGQQEYQKRDFE